MSGNGGPLSDLAVGKAGEYLVCVDRILSGMTAFPSEQGLPYDVVVQLGTRLVRVQVKTTQHPRTVRDRVGNYPGYLYHLRRTGKGGLRKYTAQDFDVIALVALDTRQVGYLLLEQMPATVTIRCESFRGKYQDEVMDAKAARMMELRSVGKTFKEVAALLGGTASNAHYLLQRRQDGVDIGKRGRYLNELTWPSVIP